jgi:tetratricopeptide (TPR) repeat protein
MTENAAEARQLLVEATAYEARRDGAAAIPAYERALALGLPPDERYRALLGLGNALRRAGRRQEAAQAFRVAVDEFPEMAAPQAHLALALHANGDGRQAMVTLLDLVLRYAPLADQEPALAEQRELLARAPAPDQDWRALADSMTRKEFVEAFDFPFLYEISGRMREALVAEARDEDTKVGRAKGGGGGGAGGAAAGRSPPVASTSSEEPFVLALRKVGTVVPSAITFGRGSTNDVVVPDVFVSKVHAFLRRSGSGWELADAGARNGAWIGGHRLDAKGAPSPVKSRDLLTFGRVVFYFLEAGDLWDRLRQRGAKVY